MVLSAAACESGNANGTNSTPASSDLGSSASTASPSLTTRPSETTVVSTEHASNPGETSETGPTSADSSGPGATGSDSFEADSTGPNSSGVGSAGVDSSGSTDGPSTTESCVEIIAIPEASTARLELPLAVFEGETPLELGAQITVDGESYSVLLLGMLLSAPRLESEDGSLVDAVFVDAADQPLPYGVFYYHSETPVASMRLAAPPGTYRSVQFHFGAPDACLGTVLKPPLNADSEMYWSWGSTFLALRLEGHAHVSDASTPGFAFHLGPLSGVPLIASTIRLEGPLAFGAQAATGPELRLDLNKALFPHPADVPLASESSFADWLVLNVTTKAFELRP